MTLDEWDLVRSCDLVLFEDPKHPLISRLVAEGVKAGPFDDEPEATRSGWALVTDPRSRRVVELARAGATVKVGPAVTPDSLTAAHGSSVVRRAAACLATLVAVMARLRSEDGCPWDLEQTHESLRVHLLEEAYEVMDAIDKGDLGAGLEEELGDLLLQVVFHSQLASDDGRFGIVEVAESIVAKLLRRHPHVFGETAVAGASDVLANWETIKAGEKQRDDPFEGIASGLPALLAAYKTQKRAASLGVRSNEVAARAAVACVVNLGNEAPTREPGDVTPAALGQALFGLVTIALARGIDPEGALRRATTAFRESLTL